MKIVAFRSHLLQRIAMGSILACLVSGAIARKPVGQVAAQLDTSSTPQSAKSSGGIDLQVVFHGYSPIGVPRNGAAVIRDGGLTDIHDITFARSGGELSPDGHFIAYDNCTSPNRAVYLAKPDGSKAQRLIPSADVYCGSIRWSPNGTKLSYVGQADYLLHVFDIASRTDTSIPNTNIAGWHWWSPASDEIVYEHGVGGRRLLHITDLQGNNRQLTFPKDFAPCERERNLIDVWAPAWSPKGDKIAFTQCGALFVISPDGKNLRQLTTAPNRLRGPSLPTALAYSPRWSPDGQWIIFSESICRIDEGTLLKRISPNDKTLVNIGKLPYCGGPFSIAPLIVTLATVTDGHSTTM